MKPVRFLGDLLEPLREFPEDARQDAGYQLEQVQRRSAAGRLQTDAEYWPRGGRDSSTRRLRH